MSFFWRCHELRHLILLSIQNHSYLATMDIFVFVWKALSKDKWIKLDQLCEQKYLKVMVAEFFLNHSLEKIKRNFIRFSRIIELLFWKFHFFLYKIFKIKINIYCNVLATHGPKESRQALETNMDWKMYPDIYLYSQIKDITVVCSTYLLWYT